MLKIKSDLLFSHDLLAVSENATQENGRHRCATFNRFINGTTFGKTFTVDGIIFTKAIDGEPPLKVVDPEVTDSVKVHVAFGLAGLDIGNILVFGCGEDITRCAITFVSTNPTQASKLIAFVSGNPTSDELDLLQNLDLSPNRAFTVILPASPIFTVQLEASPDIRLCRVQANVGTSDA